VSEDIMNDNIIAEIDAQIALLQEARAILLGTNTKRGPGRPRTSTAPKPNTVVERPTKGKLSAESRLRIAAAQRARWAKLKKKAVK
jgi:hypothetical protein